MMFECDIRDRSSDVDLPCSADPPDHFLFKSQQESYFLDNVLVLLFQLTGFLLTVLELQVSNPEQSREDSEDAHHQVRGHVQNLQGKAELVEHLTVVNSVQSVAPTLIQILKSGGWLEKHVLPQIRAGHRCCYHLVEDMVVPLTVSLEADTRELQQVVLDDAAAYVLLTVEADLDELAES